MEKQKSSVEIIVETENLYRWKIQMLKLPSTPTEKLAIEREFRRKVAERCRALGPQWQKGVYCTKCHKPFITKRHWLLWLWTFKHLIFCHHFNSSPTSVILINHEHEKIVNGRVEWFD